MAEEELKKADETKKEGYREITFMCRHCQNNRKLEDMRIITKFFPLLIVCRECENKIR